MKNKYISSVIIAIISCFGTYTGVNYFKKDCAEPEISCPEQFVYSEPLVLSELSLEDFETVFDIKQNISNKDQFALIVNNKDIKRLITMLTNNRIKFMKKHSDERNKTHNEHRMAFYVQAYNQVRDDLIGKYLVNNVDSSNIDENIAKFLMEDIENLVEIKAMEMHNKNGKQ